MGVSVADGLEVEVVGVPAAGEHGVQLLPGLLPRCEAVHGVSGDALSGMDGGGIAETGRLSHIVERQPDGQLAAVVPDSQLTAPAYSSDGQRSPFLTQSVAARRSRRSFLRVMITSPTLARFPSAKGTSPVASE